MTDTEPNSQDQRGLSLAGDAGATLSNSLDFTCSLAVVVGINDYRHVPRLRTAVPDAEETACLLRDEYGYETQLLTLFFT